MELNVESINGIVDAIKDLVASGGNFDEVLKKLLDTGSYTLDKIQVLFQKAGVSATDFNNTLQKIDPSKILEKMGPSGKILGSELNKLTGGMDNLGIKIALVASTAAGVDLLSGSFKGLGDKAKDASFQVGNITEMTQKLSSLPGGNAIQKMIGPLANWAKSSQGMINLENNFLRNTAAAGDLTDMMHSMGNTFSNMDGKMEQVARLTEKIGNASGMSASQVAKYYSELQLIPGALDKQVSLTGGLNKRLNILDATLRVARGTFRNAADVIQDMSTMYQQLGITGQDSLEILSRIHEAAQATNMPFQNMRDFTIKAAEQFKYLGDNAQGAIDIMARFGPSLKNYGLGPKAIEDLVTGFTQNISRLDMAQKAFLAGQTGTTGGGLRGAFEIDLELKEGNLAAVQERVETALKQQFGGRIVTLEEAATNEAAAAQMAKQVQLLTTGPLKMVDSAEKAYALLEAMAAGTQADKGVISTPQKSLENVIKTGDQIRERQYTELVEVNNKLEYLGNLQAITAYAVSRKTIGTEGLRTFSDRARKVMFEATGDAAQEKPITGRGAEGPLGMRNAYRQLRVDAEDMVSDIAGGFSNMSKNAKDKIEEERKRMTPTAVRANMEREIGMQRAMTSHQVVTGAIPVAPTVEELEPSAKTQKQTYNVDVICSDCNKKKFQAQFEDVNGKVKILQDNFGNAQAGAVPT